MAASIGSENGDVGFQIAPMVDVVFVLLLFFMAIAGSQIVEKRLSFEAPSESRGFHLPHPLVIDIAADGRVSMNEYVYGVAGDKELGALRDKLKSLKDAVSDGIDDQVIIRPANDARHERVIDVLNACSALKLKRLTFG